MKNLTGFFKRIQCVSSLSKVGIDIRPMNQHQVDIIRLQVFEGIVTLLNDFVIVSVTNIRPISHVEISALCCHYDPLARSALLERLPHQTFGCTGIIGRCGINKIDTIFHCGADRINTGLFRIVGAQSRRKIEENCAAYQWMLTSEEIALLDAAIEQYLVEQ